jgi:hypothetical protein
MSLFFENIKKGKKLIFTTIFIIGVSSSTFGFEIFQYVVGYYGYQKEYIPQALQTEKLVDTMKIYPVICEQLKQAGVTRETLVISTEFHLRYWCEIKIYTTFEEGTVGLMSGKSELVRWYRNYTEQDHIIREGTPEELIAFAKKIGASYTLLDSRSNLAKAFGNSKMIVSGGEWRVVIKFNQ